MAITLADFNKIWASTSPLSPYTFSDDNYNEGWNFIGQIPPSRQMWDFLQKNNDEKMQYLANNYLPLSGGTLTGNVNGVTPADSDDSTKLATTEFVDNVFLAKIISKLQETIDLPAGTSFPSTTVLSKMIANMMAEDGVQYNFSDKSAWYIKLGAKYGGLIIQGGSKIPLNGASSGQITLPISLTGIIRPLFTSYGGSAGSAQYTSDSSDYSSFNFYISGTLPYGFYWVTIGW